MEAATGVPLAPPVIDVLLVHNLRHLPNNTIGKSLSSQFSPLEPVRLAKMSIPLLMVQYKSDIPWTAR